VKTVLVVMTCHNRAKISETSVLSAKVAAKIANVSLFWSVTDDASTDNTSEILNNNCENLNLINGDGNLYWSKGMRAAWESGSRFFNPCDFVLWLNDDVRLLDYGLNEMLISMELGNASIVSGACAQDSTLEQLSYGGFVLKAKRPTSLVKVRPNGMIREIDTFNGNVVLMKWEVAKEISIQSFTHMFGDIDFGLRAKRRLFKIVSSRNYVAICSRDSVNFRWLKPGMKRRDRIREFFGKKGMVYHDLLIYNVTHCGHIAGFFLANLSYLKSLARVLFIRK